MPSPRCIRPLVVLLVALLLIPAQAAGAAPGYERVVNLTFPVAGSTTYGDSYDAPRSGGRVHTATDIMAPEGRKVFAAVGGRIEWITGLTGPVPSYGYMIRIAGNDGRDYAYVHLGRNAGPARKAYARGMRAGVRVKRGQHIGFVGCSGNASCSAPHLHFEIHDPKVRDPYGANRVNPYRSLRAAQRRGDVGGAKRQRSSAPQRPREKAPREKAPREKAPREQGSKKPQPRTRVPNPQVHPYRDIARNAHLAAILRLDEQDIMDGCTPRTFCPNKPIDRALMAKVLATALDVPTTSRDFFRDDEGLAAEPAINALAAAGVVEGCRNGRTYCPRQRVSRAQMASYLARGFELRASSKDFFADDDGNAHEANINRLAASSITLGCAVKRFCVAGTVRRGQLASFVSRALTR